MHKKYDAEHLLALRDANLAQVAKTTKEIAQFLENYDPDNANFYPVLLSYAWDLHKLAITADTFNTATEDLIEEEGRSDG